MKYYQEAIGIWMSLNKIHEFSWNYYQAGILQNLMRKTNALENIAKAIKMDDEIKEDAKTYTELDNLRTNPDFIKLLK